MLLTRATGSAHRLSDLPNVSIALGEELARVGIGSPDALRLAGAEAAWDLLRAAGLRTCIQSLLALEGAIQGMTWQSLPTVRRQELIRFAASRIS